MRDGIQVGPGRRKPDREYELQVRCSDKVSVSGFHQGQQACRLHQQAGYKTASLPHRRMQKISCHSGRRPYKRFPRYARYLYKCMAGADHHRAHGGRNRALLALAEKCQNRQNRPIPGDRVSSLRC